MKEAVAEFERQFTKRRNVLFERKIAREVAILDAKGPPSGRKAGPCNERHGRDRALDVTYWESLSPFEFLQERHVIGGSYIANLRCYSESRRWQDVARQSKRPRPSLDMNRGSAKAIRRDSAGSRPDALGRGNRYW
jgi:hypothetical protein